MVRMRGTVAALLAAMMFVVPVAVRAADATQAEIDKLKKDVEDLRRKLSGSSATVQRTSVDKALDSKYGPNASVSTRNGRLTISGLVQVWYQSVQNDNRGHFDDVNGTGVFDTNEHADNDTFRIRRTELKFTMDIHENVTAVVMIDPAREASSYRLPGSTYVRQNNVAPEHAVLNDTLGRTNQVSATQLGTGTIPNLLQDAYINYHGVVPHHDFTIGQFKPQFGEEGVRSSAQLDFVERSILGVNGDLRDLGLQVHGFWWDDRLHYWFGVFNGAGNYYGSAGQFQNRSDDNDEKDFLGSILVRPLWKDETWGSLELGWSTQAGTKGESSGRDPINTPVNGLNRNQNWAMKHAAWMSYMPGGPVRGMWVRGEWQWIKDRNAPNTVVDVLAADDEGDGYQDFATPFRSQGWYAAVGYKISDSAFCDGVPGWLKPFEFAFRYQQFENIQLADLVNPNHTDNFKTTVLTAGINYYIKGHNAKIQANVNKVDEESDGNPGRGLREVRNDNFIVSFQVAF